MQDTKQKTKVKGAGCSGHPGPAVGSTWCASQRSISISSTTIITGNARLNTETGLNGEKTMNDLNTNGPLVELVAETTGALDQLFEEIRLAIVRQYSLPNRYRSRDSDDDSSDSDSDSGENYYSALDLGLNLASASSLRPAASNSELYQSINDEEMSPSSVRNAWLSSKTMFWSASSLSELKFSTDDEEMLPINVIETPSKFVHKSSSHSEHQLFTDNEEVLPINVIETPSRLEHRSSLHSEFQFFTGEEDLSAINAIDTPSKLGHWLSTHSVYTSVDKLPRTSTLKPTWLIDLEKKLGYQSKPLWPTSREIQVLNQTWLSDSDLCSSSCSIDLASEEAAAPKCWSFLSALGRRFMSACRKLICCGGCGRNHRNAGKKTK